MRTEASARQPVSVLRIASDWRFWYAVLPVCALLICLPYSFRAAPAIAVTTLLAVMTLHLLALLGRLLAIDTRWWLRWAPGLCIALLVTPFLYTTLFHLPGPSIHELSMLVYLAQFFLALCIVIGWLGMLVKKQMAPRGSPRAWSFHAGILSFVLLLVSLYPGETQVPLSIVQGALVCAWISLVRETRPWSHDERGARASSRWFTTRVTVIGLTTVVTVALVLTGLPRKGVFRLYRSQFAELAQRDSGRVGAFIGPWYVSGCIVKPNGEIYAYTNSGTGYVMTQPDDFGFLYTPDRQRPSEESIHSLESVGEGWFAFAQRPENDS